MLQVTMNAAGVGGVIQTAGSGVIQVPANGLITVGAGDVPDLLKIGCTYVNSRNVVQTVANARAATAARIVTSTSLANGTLTVANQPDVPRQLAVQTIAGTVAISAGNVAVNYTANDGTTQIDNFSMILGASATATQNTSKGVVTVNSVIVTAMAGGASPGVQVNDTNALAIMVDNGFVNFSCLKETVAQSGLGVVNETAFTVASAAACVTPQTTPGTTNIYQFAASFVTPDS